MSQIEPLLNLTFEIDGTLPAEVLDKLPEDLRARVTNPSFIAQARAAIQAQRVANGEVKGASGRRDRIQPIRVKFGTEGYNRKERRRQMAALRGLRG